jgi:histidinol-phosphate aminotransferase
MDEAYVEFTDPKNSFIDLVKTDRNFIVLRTFSKAWGLAGIRVGYAITHPEIIDEVLKVKDSYNTTAVSQKIAMQALDQMDSLRKHVKELMLLKSSLEHEFEGIGLSVIKNDTNFILLKVQNASEISKKLVDVGIIVRDKSMETYLDNIIRITVGSKAENELLLLNIQKLIS